LDEVVVAMKPPIVCVDDDPAILALIARALSADYDVRTTEHATEALRWITLEDIAVIVSDYEMPDMTGAELLGLAKQTSPETVRILLTSKRDLETAVDGINQGEIFRFLSKPFNHHTLRATIADAVERHRALIELSGERARQLRRRALHEALEQEFPSISKIAKVDGRYPVRDPLVLASELGFGNLEDALARRR
jgi:DNA-binding NtrC family response regulator